MGPAIFRASFVIFSAERLLTVISPCLQEKQQLAADQSSLLNKAFETLKDPLKRAEYLLTLRDHPINEEDTLHAQQELLMDVMEVRQNLEEAEGDERIDLLRQNEGLPFLSTVNMGIDARTWNRTNRGSKGRHRECHRERKLARGKTGHHPTPVLVLGCPSSQASRIQPLNRRKGIVLTRILA